MPRLPSIAWLPSSPYNTLSTTLRRLGVWLKHAYSDLLQAQYAKGERGVWKGNFYKLFDNAQKKTFTSANILSGFCHTGLWSVEFSIVEERMKFDLSEPPGPSHTVTTVTPPTLYDCI